MSDRREHHFTFHLLSGRILDGDPPELPNTVEDMPDSSGANLARSITLRRAEVRT